MIEGYITYDKTSIFSPEYSHPIRIGTNTYTSPQEAILSHTANTTDILYQYVNQYRDIFSPYKYYLFTGLYSDTLNQAIHDILITKVETPNIGAYIYLFTQSVSIPDIDSISISRNVYTLSHISGNIYRQDGVISDVYDTYRVYLIGDVPLYIGVHGSFLLLKSPDIDISPQLSLLKVQ
jgi:hypothetical protein